MLAALANAVLLTGVAIYVLSRRSCASTDPPDMPAGSMLMVAIGGLPATSWRSPCCARRKGEHQRARGYLEVVGDLLGSVGVIVAAAIIAITGWLYADPSPP